MEFIREWIASIIGIIVLGSLIDIIMPSGKLRKYTQLIIGVIMMVMILKPMLNFSNFENVFDRFTISSQSSIEKMNIVKQSEMIRDKQTEQIIEDMEKRLKLDIERRVNSIAPNRKTRVKLNVDKNIKSSGFGSLRKIDINIEGSGLEKNFEENEAINKRIIISLNEAYNVPKENINIYVHAKNN